MYDWWRSGLLLFLLFTTSVFSIAVGSDTLSLNSHIIDLQLKTANAIIKKDLNLKYDSNYEFKSYDLPIKINSDGIVQQFVSYDGVSPIDVIIETMGFHYVDVQLKNLTENTVETKRTGRSVGYPEKEFFLDEPRVNKVKLTLEPEAVYELTLHYKNPKSENIEIDISIQDHNTWYNKLKIRNSSSNFWLGIFFGALVLLSLINFIFYYLFRDRTYMVYVAYITTILIYEVSIFGYFDNTWVKYVPEVMPLVANTTLILFIIFYLLFLKDFLSLKKNYPRWNKFLHYLIVFLVFLLAITDLIILTGRPLMGFSVRNFGLLVVIPIAIVFLINVVFSKRLIDRVFFSGSIILILSGIASILAYFYGSSSASDIYLQAGILIELIIFNIGLGLRSKIIQNEKDMELHELVQKLKDSEENQKHLNTNLEVKVEERTIKINEINQELTAQRDQLFLQNETIEQNLNELNDVRKNLVHTVYQKTKALHRANKELVAQNAQLEQYAFITAHNLKAPVARLKGLINIFELTNESSNPNLELIYRIKEASLDMDEVISDINKILQIKNFSKQDRKKIDLRLIIDKIIKRLQNKIDESNVKVITDLESPSIQSIDTYLESILYNLIYNGIKYSRENVDSYIQIHTYSKRNKVHIDISDNGIGIDLDLFSEKIFGLYQRFHDHVNGKGIGLYLVKTQVEALNGKITVESELNQGTMFRISFSI